MAKRIVCGEIGNCGDGTDGEKLKRRRVAVASPSSGAPVAAVMRGGPSGPSGPILRGGPSGPGVNGGPSGPSAVRAGGAVAPEIKRRKRIGKETMDLLG